MSVCGSDGRIGTGEFLVEIYEIRGGQRIAVEEFVCVSYSLNHLLVRNVHVF